MNEIQALAGHSLFAEVPVDTLERLLATAEEVRVPRGETIYTPRRLPRGRGRLLAGRVRVSNQTRVVCGVCAGGLVGAAALFTDSVEYATTLTALRDCTILLIPQMAVSLLLRESPRFAENYVRYLSGRIQFLSARLDAVTAGSAEAKLGQFLLANADGEGRLVISATQLSARIGVGRATLYRAFDALEKEGAIRRAGKEIQILSRNRLSH